MTHAVCTGRLSACKKRYITFQSLSNIGNIWAVVIVCEDKREDYQNVSFYSSA